MHITRILKISIPSSIWTLAYILQNYDTNFLEASTLLLSSSILIYTSRKNKNRTRTSPKN